MKKKCAIFPSPGAHTKRYTRGWIPPGSLIPIPIDAYKHSRRPFIQQSFWERFTAWVRYHSIQTRWDIERWLGRKFYRR